MTVVCNSVGVDAVDAVDTVGAVDAVDAVESDILLTSTRKLVDKVINTMIMQNFLKLHITGAFE
jgi:hypothetical protein